MGAAHPDPLNNQVLELYNLNEDFSQSNSLTIKIDRPQLSPADIKTLEEGMKKIEAGKE